MSNIINRGSYYQLPSKADFTGWTPGERNIYTALYKKAHGQSARILRLTTLEIMSLADIRSRVTFHAAIRGLVRRGVIDAKSVRGKTRTGQNRSFWQITLLDPATGISYAESAEEDLADPEAYEKSYDPLAAWEDDPVGLPEVSSAKSTGNDTRLTDDEIKKYFQERLPAADFDSKSDWVSANCIFHPDDNPSLSVHRATGNFRCHGCNVSGNLFSFEMNVLGVEEFDPALRSVYGIVGRKAPSKATKKRIKNHVGFYRYEDEAGGLLHELIRYRRPDREHDQYAAQHRSQDGRIWIPNVNGVRRVLYNLPAVIAAPTVMLSEGEKDADSLASLGLVDLNGVLVASSTSPFGAGNWREEYSPFLKDKDVILFGDNDKKGIAHIAAVYKSVSAYARTIRVITLYPPTESKEGKRDVTDFIEDNSLSELVKIINQDGEIVRSVK